MANESVLVQQLQDRLPECTVANATGIEKGTLLKLSDPHTGVACSADGDLFLGILAREKVASDGQTRMPYWTYGIFDIKDSGAGVTAGDFLKINGANLVATADDDQIEKHSEVVGMALQTAAANEVIEVFVGK